MLITRKDFTKQLKGVMPRINIMMIGMANIGLSYQAARFSEYFQYPHVEFDKMIAASADLAKLVKDYHGATIAEKMGNYFGAPWDHKYNEKEERFLEIEGKMMALWQLSRGLVFDMTGSAAYHTEQMELFRGSSLIIYLEADAPEKMFKRYLDANKPVCFRGGYTHRAGESQQDALARSYRELMTSCDALYSDFADVTLPYIMHQECHTPQEFAQRVRERLPVKRNFGRFMGDRNLDPPMDL